VAWGQRGTRDHPEGTYEARIHPDDAQYLWRKADGVDAASSWPDRKASDCRLMDVNGRQQITSYREISNLMAERVGFEPKLFNKINQLDGANGTRNL
jgi:hypothetical protein